MVVPATIQSQVMSIMNYLVMRNVRVRYDTLPVVDAVGLFEARWDIVAFGFFHLAPMQCC